MSLLPKSNVPNFPIGSGNFSQPLGKLFPTARETFPNRSGIPIPPHRDKAESPKKGAQTTNFNFNGLHSKYASFFRYLWVI